MSFFAYLALCGIGTVFCAAFAFSAKHWLHRISLALPLLVAASVCIAMGSQGFFPEGTFDLSDLGCSGNAMKGLTCPDYGHWRILTALISTWIFVAGGVFYLWFAGPASIAVSVVLTFQRWRKRKT